MITRKLGALLRGNATPFQIVAACVLGGLLGFAPAPAVAPALYVIVVGLLLVTNANIGLALLAAGLGKLASFAAAPLSFQIGRWLLDGPTTGLARTAINAPVLAWCGLEHYAVTGGIVLALALGLAAGLFLSRSLTAFRRRMMAAAENPTRWSELAAKPYARAVLWLFVGKRAKGTWEDKLARRVGNPIRIWGAALVVIALVATAVAHERLASRLAHRGIVTGLERASGATVDLGAVELDLAAGRMAVSELALADPGALDRDLFRAGSLELDVDTAGLLSRRFHVERTVVSDASSGRLRERPGVRLEATEKTEPAAEGAPEGAEDLDLEDVLAEAELWRERLKQARTLLERLAGDEGKGGAEGPREETLEERLARLVAEEGWFAVEAAHLVAQVPAFRLSELVVEGCTLAWLPERVFDLSGSDLSSHPWLVDAPAQLALASRDGTIGFAVDLAPASRAGGEGGLSVHWRGLPVDEVMSQLRLPSAPPLSGGTLDIELDGSWAGGRIGEVDLPLTVTFHDTVLTLGGRPTSLDGFVLPIGIAGPIDAPRIRFDTGVFARALEEAGKRELARQIEAKLGAELEGLVPGDVVEELGGEGAVQRVLDRETVDQVRGLGRGLLGGTP